MNIKKLKDTIQDCNLNFLIGSGLSCPYLAILGDIEKLLTDLDASAIDPDHKKVIRASLYTKYFNSVMLKNLEILKGDAGCNGVLDEYMAFLKCLNSILVRRKVTILSKEVNVFTTNVDIFLEKAIEELNLECNDGFNGRFRPKFSLSNFKIVRKKKSLYFDKAAELPVFNLMKLHGSLSWQIEGDDSLAFSVALKQLEEVSGKRLDADHLVEVPDGATIATLDAASIGKKVDGGTEEFLSSYEKLLVVVNPTKDKFRHTLMNQTYYELLRLYSNELEKENTVLFAMGFSFADEHIREITLRAANSNPTLMVYVIAHTSKSTTAITDVLGKNTIRNRNVEIIGPEQEDDGTGNLKDKFKFDFSTINGRLFSEILRSIELES